MSAFEELKSGVRAALATYANVHRGSGHNSWVTTQLYEQARDTVLDHLGLDKRSHVAIFCAPRSAALLQARLPKASWQSLGDREVGLPLGVVALAVQKRALPKGAPLRTGGGTARLVSPDWVVWANGPDRFEAGTPAIVNVLAFAKALELVKLHGPDAFKLPPAPAPGAREILHQDDFGGAAGQELLDRLRPTLIGHQATVPTAQGEKPFINLDNGASTPTFQAVWDAVWRSWRLPADSRPELVAEARGVCADFLGAPAVDYEVLFTANTTDSINLVAESLVNSADPGSQTVVLNTLLEHNSNELPWREGTGFATVRLGVDAEGFIDAAALDEVLTVYNQDGRHEGQRIRLVALSGASNVLGTCNDLAAICRIAHRHGAKVLVDAAQLVAHRPVDMAAWDLDYLAFSAHKAYAPFGTGVLVARRGLLRFNDVEHAAIRASGEANVGGIAALGKSLQLLRRIGFDAIQREERLLTSRALRGLAGIPGITLYGVTDPDSERFARRSGVIIFSLAGMMPSRVAKELADRGGIGVRFGCHCAHLLIKRLLGVSPGLEKFQGVMLRAIPGLALPGVTRVSLGLQNTPAEIDELLRVLAGIAKPAKSGGKAA